MATLTDARAVLLQHFGFADFRPSQREVVRSVLSGRDTLAVLPTGAGKSACFQVPDRPNLRFHARVVASETERFKTMLAELDQSEPLAIVYTPTRSVTEAVTRALRLAGYDAVPYHAGLTSAYKLGALERFTSARLQVVVATCAFGMGIDAPNVRLVVHWSMPPTLESYYQEAGRAGRDGAPARCVLLYRKGDGDRLREQLDVTFPPPRVVERLWKDPAAASRAPVSLRESAERLRHEVLDTTGRADWAPVKRRRKLAEGRIAAVENYATTRRCRRGALLGYFGERISACAGCDRCGAPR